MVLDFYKDGEKVFSKKSKKPQTFTRGFRSISSAYTIPEAEFNVNYRVKITCYEISNESLFTLDSNFVRFSAEDDF